MSITKLCLAMAIFAEPIESALAVSAKCIGSFRDHACRSTTSCSATCAIDSESSICEVLIDRDVDLQEIESPSGLRANGCVGIKLGGAACSA